MNHVTTIARLTQDPELKPLSSGNVCKLRLAVDGMGRGGRDEVGYINASIFGAGGEAAARTLSKGWLVAVDGRLEWSEWEAKDGSRRHDYEIVGEVKFLAAPQGTSQQNGAHADEPEAALAS